MLLGNVRSSSWSNPYSLFIEESFVDKLRCCCLLTVYPTIYVKYDWHLIRKMIMTYSIFPEILRSCNAPTWAQKKVNFDCFDHAVSYYCFLNVSHKRPRLYSVRLLNLSKSDIQVIKLRLKSRSESYTIQRTQIYYWWSSELFCSRRRQGK